MNVGIYTIEVGDAVLNRTDTVVPPPVETPNVKTSDGLYLRSADDYLLNVKEE